MKILAVASAGGHWIQLMRLLPAFDGNELVFASTKAEFSEFFPANKFYTLKNFSRKNKLKVIRAFQDTFHILLKEKPHVIVTTGAAPGLIVLFVGKLFMKRVIWIDSIANVEQLSLSGKIATYFADRVYTQWRHLSDNKKIVFAGSVLS